MNNRKNLGRVDLLYESLASLKMNVFLSAELSPMYETEFI